MVEELLLDDGRIPDDVKLHVFAGTVEAIVLERLDRATGKRVAISVNPDWTRRSPPGGFEMPPRPAVLEECLHVARTVAADLDHLRVDLYVIGDRIVVGELTPYHRGGKPGKHPMHHAEQLGASWDPAEVVRRSHRSSHQLLSRVRRGGGARGPRPRGGDQRTED
jgi:hypothetical protein